MYLKSCDFVFALFYFSFFLALFFHPGPRRGVTGPRVFLAGCGEPLARRARRWSPAGTEGRVVSDGTSQRRCWKKVLTHAPP